MSETPERKEERRQRVELWANILLAAAGVEEAETRGRETGRLLGELLLGRTIQPQLVALAEQWKDRPASDH